MFTIVKEWITLIVPLSFAFAISKGMSVINSNHYIAIEFANVIEDERKIQINSTRSHIY